MWHVDCDDMMSFPRKDSDMGDALFDSKFISKEVQKSLKEGFIVRPLASSDYEKGIR